MIGEEVARYSILTMMVLSYLFTFYLIATKFFTPVMLIVLFALPTLQQIYPIFLKPKPETRPEGYPDGEGGWPLYFVGFAFVNNRKFGSLFMFGLLIDVLLRVIPPTAEFIRVYWK